MFDSHCHLNFDVFNSNLPKVIKDARAAGVRYFLIPGVDIESSKKGLEISEEYRDVYSAVGLHPTLDFAKIDLEESLFQIEELIGENEDIVAIGEIGLDYYKYKSAPSVQKKFLKSQIKLASKLGKSVILHNRHATSDMITLLTKNWNNALQKNVVFHSCEANRKLLDFAKNKQIFIGIDGDVTYDSVKAEFIKRVPIELLVLETDSPFLTPLPVRKKKSFPNLPKYLYLIRDYVASLKNVSPEKIEKITTTNSKQLFNID